MKKIILIFFVTGLLFRVDIMGQSGSIKHDSRKDSPRIFEKGIISTGEYETHPAFTPSGDTLYFLKCTADAIFCSICVSYKVNGKWTKPQMASFSGRYLDADPFVTKDGNTIYFVSTRPINEAGPAKNDWDIWKTTRTSSGWGNPVHLDTQINSDADEYYPTIADNGNLYFGSSRKDGKGGADIYISEYKNNKYTAPANLGDSINSENNEYEPFIAPDESYMIFMATIPNGLGNADFYISYNEDGKWSKAKKLPEPINSSGIEWGGKITRDGKYFFFGSNRNKITIELPKHEDIQQFSKRLNSPGNGLGDIYMIDAAFIRSVKKE